MRLFPFTHPSLRGLARPSHKPGVLARPLSQGPGAFWAVRLPAKVQPSRRTVRRPGTRQAEKDVDRDRD